MSISAYHATRWYFAKTVIFVMLFLSHVPTAYALNASMHGMEEKNAIAETVLSNARLVGEGRFSVLFWKIYDAKLFAPEGNYTPDKPFALSLTYLRDIEGDKITERTLKEMEKQGYDDKEALARWEERLLALFPDVEKGMTITGVRRQDGTTDFYLDQKLLGTIDDQAFTPVFFDIWLGEKTSAPKLREKLIGEEE